MAIGFSILKTLQVLFLVKWGNKLTGAIQVIMEGGKVESSRDDLLKGEWERWEVKKDIQCRGLEGQFICTHTDTHAHIRNMVIYTSHTHISYR